MKIIVLRSLGLSIEEIEDDETVEVSLSKVYNTLTPSLENIEAAQKYIQENSEGVELKIYFVEPMNKEYTFDTSPLSLIPSEMVFSTIKDLTKLIGEDEEIIFISCNFCNDCITFLSEVNLAPADNYNFVFYQSEERIDLVEILKEFKSIADPNKKLKFFSTGVNPFSNIFSIDNILREDDDTVNMYLSLLQDLSDACRTYIQMGFLDNTIEEVQNFYHYHFNLGTTPMKLFILYFGIESPYEDRKKYPIEEFLINSEFRERLTLQLCKYLANVAINSRLLPSVEDVREWMSPEKWMTFSDKISALYK